MNARPPVDEGSPLYIYEIKYRHTVSVVIAPSAWYACSLLEFPIDEVDIRKLGVVTADVADHEKEARIVLFANG